MPAPNVCTISSVLTRIGILNLFLEILKLSSLLRVFMKYN